MMGCERCGSTYKDDNTYYCQKCLGCRVHYIPTRAEIRSICKEYQSKWTKDEEIRRRHKLTY